LNTWTSKKENSLSDFITINENFNGLEGAVSPNLCTDWYFFTGAEHIFYPGMYSVKLSPEHEAFGNELFVAAKESRIKKAEDFSTVYNNEKYRVHVMPTEEGEVYKLRRIPKSIPKIDSINFPKQVKRLLGDRKFLNSGLFLIAGEHGNGKSTSCAATIMSRMRDVGGVCLTIEDPAEFDLSGKIGEKGYCFQTEINEERTYQHAIKAAMRAYPVGVHGVLFIGEIRDPGGAAEALRACVNGRLVIASIHANNIVDGLRRIVSLAAIEMGSKEEANNLLASGFRVICHQKLNNNRLYVNALLATDNVFGVINSGKYEMLSTEMDRQQTLLRADTNIELKKLA